MGQLLFRNRTLRGKSLSGIGKHERNSVSIPKVEEPENRTERVSTFFIECSDIEDNLEESVASVRRGGTPVVVHDDDSDCVQESIADSKPPTIQNEVC